MAFAEVREGELEPGACAPDAEGSLANECSKLTDWCCRKRVKAMLPWLQSNGITLEQLRLIDTEFLRTALKEMRTVSTLQKGLFLGVVKCLQKSATESVVSRGSDSGHVSHVDDCALIAHRTLEPAIEAMQPLATVHSAIGREATSPRLTLKQLLKTKPSMRKQTIGELLFPKIQATVVPRFAAKITGMLLEMDNSLLLEMVYDSALLTPKIKEAMRVLKEFEIRTDLKNLKKRGTAETQQLTSSGKTSETRALPTQMNSLFACISHACAGLSYAKVALMAGISFTLAPPKAATIECSDLTQALERVSVASVYRFEVLRIPTGFVEDSRIRELRERVCAQIRNGQCVISNDSKGHYSLLYDSTAFGSLFRMRSFPHSEDESELCALVSLSSRKLLVFVSEDCSVKPLTDRQLFGHCLRRAADSNSVFMQMYTQMEEMGVGTAEERRHFEDVLECTLKAEGVAALHRLAESIADGGVQLTRAIRSVQLFYDARTHVCHWLQHNFGLQRTLWNAELKLIKDAHFEGFAATELSPDSVGSAETRRCLSGLLLELAKIETEAMSRLQVA